MDAALLAVQLFDPDSIFGWAGVISTAVAAAAIAYTRAKGSIQQVLQDELDAVRSRANRLHTENEELVRTNSALSVRNSELTQMTDLTPLMERMGAYFDRLAETLAQVSATQERMANTLTVIERRLNGDTSPPRADR